MTDFKPGDVAMTREGVGMIVTCFHEKHDRGPHWHYAAGGWDRMGSNNRARRLVVIDPESAEDMGRLSSIWHATRSADLEDDMRLSVNGWPLRNALREYANPKPPKPAEPEGLGAVVEDASQRRWVLTEHGDKYPWFCGDWRNWESIAAVRVLSEGVQP